MKDFIRQKLRESMDVTIPTYDMPEKIQATPEEYQALKSLTWQDIGLEPKENSGSPIFHIDITFRNPELNKFASSIVFSIQMLPDRKDNYKYYHPHMFISDELQGIGIGSKILKAFVMDFGHIYVSKARTHNPNFTKMVLGLGNDPDMELLRNNRAILVLKNGNPDKEDLSKIIQL